jgi:hypothetical protein
MRFINALDVIFRLVAAWKVFDNFEETPWHKPTDRWIDGHDFSTCLRPLVLEENFASYSE